MRTVLLLAPMLLGACAGQTTRAPSVDEHVPPFARVPYQPFSRDAVVAIALREWRLFGSQVDDKWYRQHFRKALRAAGITDRIRTFQDVRHARLTNLAATGASPIVVMATAGHRSIA